MIYKIEMGSRYENVLDDFKKIGFCDKVVTIVIIEHLSDQILLDC